MSSLFSFFLKGIIIGFSVAAIPGPIGVLCIRKTLVNGMYIGFMLGLGAAVANALFALIAGFGIASVSSFLIKYHVALNMTGGMFLAYLGIKTFLATPEVNATVQENGALRAFVLTFLLTITNPMTILYFVTIIAGTGIVLASNDYIVASILVGGVFFGSAAWFILMCCLTSLFRSRINAAVLKIINQLSGLLIIGFALYVFLNAFRG